MTIASEITRIQGAKADIKTAIENKGVTVGSDLTIDGYACCIDEIQSGGSAAFGFIAVGGGGAGACGSSSNACDLGGSGGGGEVLISNGTLLQGDIIDIEIGKGGEGRYCYQNETTNGGCTCLSLDGYTIVAKGGCAGINRVYEVNYKGGGVSGGGHIQGNDYKSNTSYYAAGGGGGAGGNGCMYSFPPSSRTCACGGNGGVGMCGFGGGGGGSSSHLCGGCGVDGGANGAVGTSAKGCDATNYGGGGSGGIGACCGGNGCQGIVKIWYPEDGSYGITEGGGGTVTKENGCVIHTFTESGAFFKERPVKMAKVLIVGGGGGASCDGTGGGGGGVCIGYIQLSSSNTITIGCGGCFNQDGGDTCIAGDGVNVVINGGKANGCSGNGCLPGCCGTGSNYYRGGGGGAFGNGEDGRYESSNRYGGYGGCGTPYCCGYCYGYGGGGYGYQYGGYSRGGGYGYGYCNYPCQCCRNARCYGGGGGGGCPGVTSGTYMGGNGYQGIVKICYPTDGSYGICCATGGTVTTEGSYTVHTFTSNGTFTIVS